MTISYLSKRISIIGAIAILAVSVVLYSHSKHYFVYNGQSLQSDFEIDCRGLSLPQERTAKKYLKEYKGINAQFEKFLALADFESLKRNILIDHDKGKKGQFEFLPLYTFKRRLNKAIKNLAKAKRYCERIEKNEGLTFFARDVEEFSCRLEQLNNKIIMSDRYAQEGYVLSQKKFDIAGIALKGLFAAAKFLV